MDDLDVVVPKFIVGWIQIRHRMRGPSGDIINTFSYRAASPGTRYTGAQLTLLANDWRTSIGALLQPLVGAAVQFIDVTANDLGDEFGEQGVAAYPPLTFGTSTGEQLPANVAIASTWRTKFRGRAYRGRSFWGGFTEAATNGDTFVAAFASALANVLAALFIYHGPSTVAVVPVVASRVKGKLTDITSYVLTTIMDSQRRRLTGRGR